MIPRLRRGRRVDALAELARLETERELANLRELTAFAADKHRRDLAELRAEIDRLAGENAKLREQQVVVVDQLPAATVADNARLRRALLVYDNRLAVYEGRPTPIDCPRACCAEQPAPTGVPA